MGFNLEELLREHSEVREATGHELRICCPKCGDTKFHLYVNLRKAKNKQHWAAWCHRCSTPFRASDLIGLALNLSRTEVISYLYQQEIQEMPVISDLNEGIQRILTKEEKINLNISSSKLRPVPLPLERKPLDAATAWGRIACKYLKGRGISLDYARKLGITYCSSGRYRRYLIIPIKDIQGETIYFATRAFTRGIKKNLNPVKQEGDHSNKSVVFGIDRAAGRSTVIITEGVFDALLLGDGAVSLLGKHLSKIQKSILTACEFEHYVVMLDGDAWGDTIELARQLLPFGKVSAVKLPEDQDPADVILSGGIKRCFKNISEISLPLLLKSKFKK